MICFSTFIAEHGSDRNRAFGATEESSSGHPNRGGHARGHIHSGKRYVPLSWDVRYSCVIQLSVPLECAYS